MKQTRMTELVVEAAVSEALSEAEPKSQQGALLRTA